MNQLEELTQKEEQIVFKELANTLTEIPFVVRKYHHGEIQKNRFLFHHQFARCYGIYFKNQCSLKKTDPLLKDYLKGLEISCQVPDGWGVIVVEGYPLGLYKASQNHLKNHYPKGLRSENRV